MHLKRPLNDLLSDFASLGSNADMHAGLEGLVDRLAKEGAVFMTMEEAAREAATKL